MYNVPDEGGGTFGGGANGVAVKEITLEASFAAAPPPETLILEVTLTCMLYCRRGLSCRTIEFPRMPFSSPTVYTFLVSFDITEVNLFLLLKFPPNVSISSVYVTSWELTPVVNL